MASIKRIVAIMFVFGGTTVAWMILGGVMTVRSHDTSSEMRGDVAELWGSPQSQQAPTLTFHWQTEEQVERTERLNGKTRIVRTKQITHHDKRVSPSSTRVHVDLDLDQRLKGLIWYSLFDAAFDGTWTYEHSEPLSGTLQLAFAFPDASGLYDDFRFVVNGVDRGRQLRPENGQVTTSIVVSPGDRVELQIGYSSRGMDQWAYLPSPEVANLEAFELTMTTDFDKIDFPAFSLSPSKRQRTDTGWQLNWSFSRVVTGRNIGMVMPAQIQPGEMAAQLAFSAPISLMFFFLLIFVLATLRSIEIHPINYFFLGGAFFSFHLLFGYSVDHLHLVPAFVVSSAVSTFLVVSYLRIVVSNRFAFVEAAIAQIVYMVGFSLAHFWEGFTGLTVTILSVSTLFVLMQLTARLKWSEVLNRTATASSNAG